MKKYIKPQIEVSNIELGSIICTSGVKTNIDKTNTIQKPENILSKEYAFEDDWGYEE